MSSAWTASVQPVPCDGEPVDRALDAGQEHTYTWRLASDRGWLIEVEQRGIDVELAVEPPGGEPWTVDGPFDRQGVETLFLEPAVESEYRVRIVSREPLAAAGKYRLSCRPAASEREQAFARTMSEASRQYVIGEPDARRRAHALYQQAAELAEPDSAPRARALYAAMVLQRLLDENAAALAASDGILNAWQTLGNTLFAAYTLNEIGLNRWLIGEVSAARDAFAQAMALLHAIEDGFGEAVAASNLCLMDLIDHRLRDGLACYERVLPKLESVQAMDLAGDARTNLGRGYDVLGETGHAVAQYEQVLDLKRQTGDVRGEARTLNNLAALYREEGEIDRALTEYGRALELFERLGDIRWQARVLGNIGQTYRVLGEGRRAWTYLNQAIAAWRRLDTPRGLATALANLARVAVDLGDYEAALETQQESLDLFRSFEDVRGQALAFRSLGVTQEAMGDVEAAFRSFRTSLRLLEPLDLPTAKAHSLLRLGLLELDTGQESRARSHLETALSLARTTGHGIVEAEAVYALARLERVIGHRTAALERAEQAVALVDRLRTRIGPMDLRASFSSLRHGAYAMLTDLRMEHHQRQPGQGFDAAALSIADLARARTLVELLRRSDVGAWAANERLTEALRRAERRLQSKADRALRLRSEQESERQVLLREKDAILQHIERLEAEIRQASPLASEWIPALPLDVDRWRQGLAEDTAVLYYALGERKSFLWYLDRHSLESFELPGAAQIEALARNLHLQLASFDVRDRRAQLEALTQLGEMLLGPVAPRLDGKRLAISTDGALLYVPFAALILPASDGAGSTFLVDRNEGVQLPSLTASEALNRTPRPSAPRSIAIFADPAFATDGPGERVVPGAITARSGSRTFEPLPATRREAETIAALFDQPYVALGHRATRERALASDMSAFRILHFATHGMIDTQHPSLSGLALAQIGADGEPLSGFLGLRDIYRLNLSAELSVLSGCRTALGREIRGEGLMGLARGFMYAGSRQVLASLWPVDDHATAELMRHFYRALKREGSPAKALRQAQLAMKQQRRYRDPFFWAAFVLIGHDGLMRLP